MIDTSRVRDVQVEGIDYKDYPDFCDAYISDAIYCGRDMTELELDELNNCYGEFVNLKAHEQII